MGMNLKHFLKRLQKFCEEHGLSESTVSQRSLSNTYGIERMIRLDERLRKNMQKIDRYMSNIEKNKQQSVRRKKEDRVAAAGDKPENKQLTGSKPET